MFIQGLTGTSVFACHCNLTETSIKIGLLIIDDPDLEHSFAHLTGIDRNCQITVKLPGNTGVLTDQILEILHEPDSV